MDKIKLNQTIVPFFIFCFVFLGCSSVMAELRLDSVSHTLGIMEQDLVVDLKGEGFDADTRVSMYLDSGNTAKIIGSVYTDGSALGVTVVGNTAYVADAFSGLQVIDISDPTNPTIIGSLATPGSAKGVTVVGSTAYVADWSGGLQVIDINDPADLSIIGFVDTPGDANGVTVAGSKAYVADWSGGLQVIDISDPADPTIIGSVDMPNETCGVTIVGSTAYVANINGLWVIDISDPADPTIIGSVDSPSYGHARGVTVVNSTAYVADSGMGMTMIDISDPTDPTIIGSVRTPGVSYGVTVVNSIAYVADYKGGLQVIDISDPADPIIIGSVDTPGSAFGVTVVGNTAYVADALSGLQVIDISNPGKPTFISSLDTPGSVEGVDVVGDIAYVADGSGGLQVIDISDPADPTFIGSYDTPDSAKEVTIVDSKAYVTAGGLQVIDISNPADPIIMGSVYTSSMAVSVVGSKAYVAGWPRGLEVIDISDSENPSIMGSVVTPGMAEGVTAVGNTVYVADGNSGLQVIDVSVPANPSIIGFVDTPDNAEGVTVVGSTAYVADGDSGLQVIDVSDPENPSIIGFVDTPGYANKVTVVGSTAYVADGMSGLQMIDISDSVNPNIIGSVYTTYASGVAIAGSTAYVSGWGDLVILPIPVEIPVNSFSDTEINVTLPSPQLADNFTLRVFNSSERNNLPGAVTFTDNPDLLTTKAIIVAGTNAAVDSVWLETKAYADQAYENLRYQGYAPEDILYLSADFTGDCSSAAASTAEGVDCGSTLANLEYAIKTWAMIDPGSKDLFLYMVDHGGTDTFHVNSTEILTAQDLDIWLDYLQSNMPDADPSEDFKIIILYDACESGSFISSMSPPDNKTRITMASSSANQPAYFLDTTHSFSYHFWSTLSGKSGDKAKPSEAYMKGSERMIGYQTALLDANGNGFPNEQEDHDALASVESTIYALRRQYHRNDMAKPVVAIVSDDQTLNGGLSADLMAGSVYDIDGDAITRVWGEVLPPDANPDPTQTQTDIDTVELIDPNVDGIYEGIYSSFTAAGTYVITYFAVDAKGIYSLPKTSLVTQLSGTASPADAYEDDDSDFESRVIVPNNPTPQLHTFHESDDTDWLKFYAVAGKTYKIKTSNVTLLCDTEIELYDTDGTTTPPIPEHSNPENYIYTNNGSGEGDNLVWTCLSDGIYYVKLTNNTSHYGANVRYELQVYEPTADFFTQGQVEGNVKRKSDDATITSGEIITSGAHALVEDGRYIMFLEPDSYTLVSNIDGYINDEKNINISNGSVLADIDFVLSEDQCPGDPNKTEPGECGCGFIDTDSDEDGTADCNDTDDDNDGMPDIWENQYYPALNPLVDDAALDADYDGFTNLKEYQSDTDPTDEFSHPASTMPWLLLLLGDE